MEEEPSGERVLRVTLHCTDPDWEAVNWAPEGLLLEVRVPAEYPEPDAAAPSLSLLGPEDLPERFARNVPLLFAEAVRKAPPRTAAIYRGLQYLDRFLAPLFLKVRAAERAAEDAAEVMAARREEAARRQREFEERAAAQEAAAVAAAAAAAAAAEAAADAERRKAAAASWSNDDQERLEQALLKFKDDADVRSRWRGIAEYVGGGRSARDCADRYKACREFALGNASHPDEADSGDDTDGGTVAPAAPAPATFWSAADVRRQGIEVRFIGLTLEGFDTLVCTALRLQVVCDRCKKPSDLCSEGAGPVARTLEANCGVCKQQLALRVVPEICHAGCPAVAHVLGVGCHPVQVLRGDYEATCGSCYQPVRVRNVGPGFGKRSSCPGCFEKSNLAVEGADLIGGAVAQWRQVADTEGEKQSMRRLLQEARTRERDLGVKAGQPLPDFGACKHFGKSYRWLRFPCCGRAFPCINCHDEQTDHPHEWANRMLCGHCAHEQIYRDNCAKCGAAQTRHKSAFWEGGDGCRNRTLMSKHDNHKYKGLGKTVSSHAAAKLPKSAK